MWRAVPLAAIFLVCATALAAAPERRVYKVDSVIATLKGRILTIQAKGATQTGGWRKPKLRLMRSPPAEGRTVIVEFLAVPPPPGMTVIEALVPIEAALRMPARPHIASVRAVADANEVTSQVLH